MHDITLFPKTLSLFGPLFGGVGALFFHQMFFFSLLVGLPVSLVGQFTSHFSFGRVGIALFDFFPSFQKNKRSSLFVPLSPFPPYLCHPDPPLLCFLLFELPI